MPTYHADDVHSRNEENPKHDLLRDKIHCHVRYTDSNDKVKSVYVQ